MRLHTILTQLFSILSAILQQFSQHNIIFFNIFTAVHCLTDQVVRKISHHYDDEDLSDNIQIIHNEACIYTLLSDDSHFSVCLSRD